MTVADTQLAPAFKHSHPRSAEVQGEPLLAPASPCTPFGAPLRKGTICTFASRAPCAFYHISYITIRCVTWGTSATLAPLKATFFDSSTYQSDPSFGNVPFF